MLPHPCSLTSSGWLSDSARPWPRRSHSPSSPQRTASQPSRANRQNPYFLRAGRQAPAGQVMEEPFPGLDPVNIVLLREAIRELRDRGKTVVLSTHQMETVE